ncbi:hypothetical protein DPMN_081909 [Dreissena polymorpha]|uniref:Uncharacterized protein n=1 Tax=Dreissena polymorpha TaxID=45954 RepID=A0A9D3Y9I3_DREPO|nr:hypothetical protein DPMN_081909 [Dreissena polymorpha]
METCSKTQQSVQPSLSGKSGTESDLRHSNLLSRHSRVRDQLKELPDTALWTVITRVIVRREFVFPELQFCSFHTKHLP